MVRQDSIAAKKLGDAAARFCAEQRQIGGLGILLVKKTMDDVRYEYVNDCNVLTIVKAIGTGKRKGLT